MGGKSSRPVIGYWYKLLIHLGLVRGEADRLLEFRGGEKTAWSGSLASGDVDVDAEELWGGEEKEGGIVGTLTFLPGSAAQTPSALLTAQLGPEQSAYRGRATVIFNGRYGAFNPYPKPASFLIERLFKGWDGDDPWEPDLLAVPIGERLGYNRLSVFFSLDYSDSMNTIVSGSTTRLDIAKEAIGLALDRLAALRRTGRVKIDVGAAGWAHIHTESSTLDASVDDIVALKAWVNALTSPPPVNTDFTQGIEPALDFFAALNAAGIAGSPRRLFFVTDGLPFGSTDDDAAALAEDLLDRTGAYTVGAGTAVDMYGINLDLADTSATAKLDNTPGDGVPVVDDGDTDALVTALDLGSATLYGMNAVHILYYSITAAHMEGVPVIAVNDASFLVAAQTCYDEGFGLCTKHNPAAESVEDFQQRICNLIGAKLSQSRTDGQYYLTLIRDDYDLESLEILTDDDILEYEETPGNPLEAVNQVSVEWFDPVRKEKRTTAPLQALGAIEAVGGIIAESWSHPEIPYEALALLVGARNLALKSSSATRHRLTTNRVPYAWLPGKLFRLQAPRRGIADMVCVLGEIDAGVPLSGSMRLVTMQHVGAMPATVYVDPEPGVDNTPPQTPVASPAQATLEAPYVELAARMRAADLAALTDDSGFLLAVAKRPSAGDSFALYTAADAEAFAHTGAGDWCPSALVVESATADPAETDFTLAGATDLDEDVEVGSLALWGDEWVRVDAIDVALGTVSFGRGCADTVSIAHDAGERVWFLEGNAAGDGREYADGEVVHAKLLTRTATQVLALADAVDVPATMDGRQARPYPPGLLAINGAAYPAEIDDEDVTLTWAHRDRVLQADQLVDQTAASIGPEGGTTYTARYFLEGVLQATHSGLTGTTDSWTPTDLGTIRIELESVRDGLTSFTMHAHEFVAGAVPWTPADLTLAAKVWLDDDSTVTDAGSGACSQWNDRSANLYHYTQATSTRRPLIVNAGINGRRLIRFDGTSDVLASTVTGVKTVMRNTSSGWAFFVWQRQVSTGGGSDRVLLVFTTNAATNSRFTVAIDRPANPNKISATVRRLDADSATTLASATSVNSGWHMGLVTMDWAAGDLMIYVDGALDAQNLSATTSGSTSNTDSAENPCVGAVVQALSSFADVDLAALLVGSGGLPSSTEVDKLFGWAAHRYGLTSLLPSSHPYKLDPPTTTGFLRHTEDGEIRHTEAGENRNTD